LELLLDAGMLAIYYSKGRSNGGGDLYYTFVKYLRRAKDGPVGLVLPTHEKNLAVKLDDSRMKELRALIGDENPS
jgi:predicted ribosome quality control (RQC) complex YloA/Tae2 family protein